MISFLQIFFGRTPVPTDDAEQGQAEPSEDHILRLPRRLHAGQEVPGFLFIFYFQILLQFA